MTPKTPAEAVALFLRTQATLEILELLADSASAVEAGRKALLLAFLVNPAWIGTQAELAKRMGVSEGRASQMLKVFRVKLQTR